MPAAGFHKTYSPSGLPVNKMKFSFPFIITRNPVMSKWLLCCFDLERAKGSQQNENYSGCAGFIRGTWILRNKNKPNVQTGRDTSLSDNRSSCSFCCDQAVLLRKLLLIPHDTLRPHERSVPPTVSLQTAAVHPHLP